jgi:hypothetical protein
MAGGRSDPDETLSLVFLFFYGPEYRLFKEGAVGDAPQLIAEVERLLSIYSHSRSFQQYAGYFLAIARACLPGSMKPAIDLQRIPQEMPLDARRYLGGKLADGRDLGADDALVWAVSSPVSWRKRWPNDRKDVFEHLWRSRFAVRFPSGRHVKISSDSVTDQLVGPSAARMRLACVRCGASTIAPPICATPEPPDGSALTTRCAQSRSAFV